MTKSGIRSVSILLPVFNGSKYLADAVDSLTSQSFEDYELIICDDCSEDGSFELVEKLAASDERIKVFRNDKRLGLFKNYNRCLELSEAQFIKPFAQDDLLHPDCLKISLEALERYPTVSLMSVGRRRVSADGELIDDSDLPNSSNFVDAGVPITGSEVIQKSLFPLVNYIGEPSCVMFRRSAMGVGFDANFYHLGDIEYWLRILLEGDYYFEAEDLCYFRSHQGSASTVNSRQLLSAVDIVRLSRKFGWIIEGCDYTEEEFLCQTVDDFSSYMRTLIASDNMSLGDLRQAEDILSRREEILAAESEEERESLVSRMAEDLANFRELAYIAIMQLGQKGTWVNSDIEKVAENKIVIRSLEDQLRDMLNSPSWKATKLLREFNRPFINDSEIRFDQEKWQSSTNRDTVVWQRQYIDYLRNLIDKVLASRSWKLSGPIRAISESEPGGDSGGNN